MLLVATKRCTLEPVCCNGQHGTVQHLTPSGRYADAHAGQKAVNLPSALQNVADLKRAVLELFVDLQPEVLLQAVAEEPAAPAQEQSAFQQRWWQASVSPFVMSYARKTILSLPMYGIPRLHVARSVWFNGCTYLTSHHYCTSQATLTCFCLLDD